MNSPTEDYKFYTEVNGIKDIAYFNLFEKYHINKLDGPDKVIEIDDTDQETLLINKFGGYPIPGMIYTYIYGEPAKIEDPPKTPKEYIDLVPLTFCLNITRDGFTGLNLNLLPATVRLSFLETFYNLYKNFLKNRVDRLAQNNKLAINKEFINLMGSGESRQILKLISKVASENFSFAFRRYQYIKIINFRAIEYSEWRYIPFYEPKDAIKKLNLSVIYNLYNKNKQTKEL
jgi:hypothetical protein